MLRIRPRHLSRACDGHAKNAFNDITLSKLAGFSLQYAAAISNLFSLRNICQMFRVSLKICKKVPCSIDSIILSTIHMLTLYLNTAFSANTHTVPLLSSFNSPRTDPYLRRAHVQKLFRTRQLYSA